MEWFTKDALEILKPMLKRCGKVTLDISADGTFCLSMTYKVKDT